MDFIMPAATPNWFKESYSAGGTDDGQGDFGYALVLAAPEQGYDSPDAHWNVLTRPTIEGDFRMVVENAYPASTAIETILTQCGPETYYGVDLLYVTSEDPEAPAVGVPMVYLYNVTTPPSSWVS